MNYHKNNFTLYNALENSACQNPKKVAIYFDNTYITYEDLLTKIDKISKLLIANNITLNSVVTLVAHNSIELIAIFYAINKIGAIANILHYGVSENEIISALKLTNSKIIYTDRYELQENIHLREIINLFLLPNLNFKKIHDENIIPLNKSCSVILYTSGSTAVPKGVMFQNYQFNAFFEQSKNFYPDITSSDTILVTLPIFHGFGLATGVHNNLTLGSTIVILSSNDRANIDKVLNMTKPSFIIGVPSFFELLMYNTKMIKADLSFVKKILIGGAPTYCGYEQEINNFFKKHNSKALVQIGYGLTEALSGVTLNKTGESIGVGIPFKDNKIKIINIKNGIGEICIQGPTLMNGYLNAKSTIDKNGWLHTEDIGYLKDENLYIVGRMSRIVSVSGYSVSLNNIEKQILKKEEIKNVAVISVPDKIRGNKIIAIVVSNLSEDEIIKHCKKNLPIFAIPRVEKVKEIPLTMTGKIDYEKLKGLFL